MKKTEQTRLDSHTESYCICSAYDDGYNKGRVRVFECVLDGTKKTPCYYVLMSEKTFYDDKNHRIEVELRGLLWRIKHFLWIRKRKDK